jgi:hypothetical protein
MYLPKQPPESQAFSYGPVKNTYQDNIKRSFRCRKKIKRKLENNAFKKLV